MCGIVACLANNGQCLDNIDIKTLAQIISHRGPDDIGAHKSSGSNKGNGFLLGHTRLSIVGPNHGHQPISHSRYRGANPKCTGLLSKLLSEPVHLGSAPL